MINLIYRFIDWWSANIPPWVLIALIAHGAIMGTVAYLILLERKVASWVQDRIGPNRVGIPLGGVNILGLFTMPKWTWWGLGQPLVDALKFMLKEEFTPAHAFFLHFAKEHYRQARAVIAN